MSSAHYISPSLGSDVILFFLSLNNDAVLVLARYCHIWRCHIEHSTIDLSRSGRMCADGIDSVLRSDRRLRMRKHSSTPTAACSRGSRRWSEVVLERKRRIVFENFVGDAGTAVTDLHNELLRQPVLQFRYNGFSFLCTEIDVSLRQCVSF